MITPPFNIWARPALTVNEFSVLFVAIVDYESLEGTMNRREEGNEENEAEKEKGSVVTQ